MATCRVSAPAKVILLGEHWVVHGSRAVATAVGLYSRAVGEEASSGTIVESRELGVVEDITRCRRLCFLLNAARYIASTVSRPLWPARIRIESDIPMGAGMGSSASVAAAFSACYAILGGLEPSPSLILRAAYEAEKVVHGNPSGIDNSVATLGGFIVYRKGEGAYRLEGVKLSGARLLVIDTGVSRSTRVAVEKFSRRLRALGELGYNLLSLMDRIIDEAIESLRTNNLERLGLLMDLSHGLLNSMGVSHESLEEAIHLARREGAYGAKLTGAGMGGTAIALVPESSAGSIRSVLAEKGFRVYEVDIGVQGIMIDQ